MSPIHLHLLLNHLPVIGIPLAGAVLTWGVVKQDRMVQRTALGLLLFLSVMTVPVFLSGAPAEEGVESLPGVAEAMIERHESFAKVALVLTAVAGTIALAGIVLSRTRRPVPRGVAYAGLVAIVLATAALTSAAYLGGQIRHTEIRSAAPARPELREEGEPEAVGANRTPRSSGGDRSLSRQTRA